MAIYQDQVDEGITYLKAAQACFEELRHSTNEKDRPFFHLLDCLESLEEAIGDAGRVKRLSKTIEDIKREMNE